jgi:hypothetical protein
MCPICERLMEEEKRREIVWAEAIRDGDKNAIRDSEIDMGLARYAVGDHRRDAHGKTASSSADSF